MDNPTPMEIISIFFLETSSSLSNDIVAGFWALEMTLEEKFRKVVELLKDFYWAYDRGDNSIRGVLLLGGLVELKIDYKKRLYIKQKEPFQALSESDISLWQPH